MACTRPITESTSASVSCSRWGAPTGGRTLPDIFLSYNREDQAVARRFAEAFEAEGFDVWWDATLKSGEAYDEVTETALRTAKAVVVLWSPRSVVSRWVRAEATLADRNKTLVPCTIAPCERPIMFELTQTAELSHWQGDATDKGWQAFLGDVRRIVGKDSPSAEVPPVKAALLPLPSKPSIAVMPFANLSGDPDQEYFADGMVVEITNALTRFKSLFVIASGSGLSFKGKGVSPQEAARQLGVRYVLEGSVRKGGNRVRISVQLIDASGGAQIWTERFEDTLDDVFALQDRITLSVAGKIEPTVRAAEIRRAISRPTDNIGSYDLYLRALARMSDMSRAGVLEALDLLRRATSLDPEFAPALCEMAGCHTLIDAFGWSDDADDNLRLGVEIAHKALKAGKDDACVMASVALVLYRFEGDVGAALSLVDRAIDLNPGSSTPWFMGGILGVNVGDADLAVGRLEMSRRLDPMSHSRPRHIGTLGQARFLQGRFAEAALLLTEASKLSEFPAFCLWLAASFGHLGQVKAARKALARYRTLASTPVDDYVRSSCRAPAAVALVLDGIALAEGAPVDVATP